MNRIRKGDKVRIISGKYAKQEGTVLKVFPKENTAIVDGLNKAKIHQKPSQQNEKGGIIEKELPINLSKLALIDPKEKTITKVKFVLNDDKKKVRVTKKSNSTLHGK